jgi:hypothetical protein
MKMYLLKVGNDDVNRFEVAHNFGFWELCYFLGGRVESCQHLVSAPVFSLSVLH